MIIIYQVFKFSPVFWYNRADQSLERQIFYPVYLLLSKVHFTDLIKGQQHFTVIQIARQDRAFWITVTEKKAPSRFWKGWVILQNYHSNSFSLYWHGRKKKVNEYSKISYYHPKLLSQGQNEISKIHPRWHEKDLLLHKIIFLSLIAHKLDDNQLLFSLGVFVGGLQGACVLTVWE